jgi:DNA-binding LacI/PurR family transcriptional regulator
VQPSYEIGSKSAELLLKRMEKPGRRYEKILLAPELRIRE